MFYKIKRNLALILILFVFLISCVVCSSAADYTFSSKVQTSEISAGDSVDIIYSVSGLKDVKITAIEFDADDEIFEIVSGEWLDKQINIVPNTVDCFHKEFDINTQKGSMAISVKSPDGTVLNHTGADLDCSVFKLTLKIKGGTRNGTYKIKAEFDAQDASFRKIATLVNTADVIVNHAHVFDNDCDSECNKCSYVRIVKHINSTEWNGDDYYHWRKCQLCGEITELQAHSGGSATCSEKVECQVCLKSYGTKIAHNFSEIVNDNYLVSRATCQSTAVYYKSCTLCGEKSKDVFEYGEIDKNNHIDNFYYENQLEPTCEKDGYSGDKYCQGCNEIIEKGEDIHIGHRLVLVDTPASCNKSGFKKHYKCTGGCGKLFFDESAGQEVDYNDVYVDLLGHVFGAWIADSNTSESFRICTACGFIEHKHDQIKEPERTTQAYDTSEVTTGEMQGTQQQKPVDKNNSTKNDAEGVEGDTENKNSSVLVWGVITVTVALVATATVLVIYKYKLLKKQKRTRI